MTKICFRCRVAKPRDEFYAHPMMADGLLGKCKECTRVEARANRAAKAEEKRAYDRGRSLDRAAKGHWRKKLQKARVAHPEHFRAYAKVRWAVTTGALVRPAACEVCQRPEKVHAHHDDYDKPLDIRWLCALCHSKAHHS